jgi:outer membrane protein assembly factor BamB
MSFRVPQVYSSIFDFAIVLLSIALFLSAAVGDTLSAQEANVPWPTFRGPDGNGVSTTAQPPVSWSSTRNVAWKRKIPGRGSSSPIIVGNRVFVTAAAPVDPDSKPELMSDEELIKKFDANGNGKLERPEMRAAGQFRRAQQAASLPVHKFMVLCFDRSSGDPIWQKTAVEAKPHEANHPDHGYASASPVTDGQQIYVNFGSRGLYCYNLDGNLIWKRDDLGQMTTRGTFGEGSSVAIEGDVVILPWDHEGQSYIETLHRDTGKTIWKVMRDEPSNWVTPRVVEVDGRKQILQVGQNFTRGYDLETGAEIWKASGMSQRPVACPVVKGNVGFVASARGGAILQAILLDQQGDISTNGLAWSVKKQTPDIPSLLLSENRLFFIGSNRGILSCVNADTGKAFIEPQRLPLDSVYSSPVAANGNVFVTGRKGKTVILRDAVTFEIISTNDIGEPVDATLALADQEIFIRGRDHLFCIRNK